MKTLSIQQPWASLICSGLKDVENRTWSPSEAPGRILIHASSRKVPKSFPDTLPLDWTIACNGIVNSGYLPFFDLLPTGAVIGYVTVKGFADRTESLWDAGEDQIKWLLEDAYLFDEPIQGVKGQLNLFDFPLDEDNLPPAHKADILLPSLEGTTAVLPVCDGIMDAIVGGERDLVIDLTSFVRDAFCESGKKSLRKIERVRLVSRRGSAEYAVEDAWIDAVMDTATNAPVVEENLFGVEIEWDYIQFRLK